MANDLSKIKQVPDPVSARSPVADSPDTSEEESGKVARLLLKAKKQYQAGQRAEERLRRDMQDDRRFRLGRLGDESFQWPDRVWQQRKSQNRATLQTKPYAGVRGPGPQRGARCEPPSPCATRRRQG